MCWKLVEQALATDTRPTARHVLMVLAHRANHETGKCFPGLASLVRNTGLSRRAVQNAIADLVREGQISRFEDEGKSVQYYVHPVVGRRPGRGARGAPVGCISDTPDVHVMHPTGASPAPEPEPTINKKSADQAVDEAACEILRLIGWATSPDRLQQVRKKLHSWQNEGYELDRDIVAGVAFAIQERPGRTNSLKRFDVPIKQLYKLRMGKIRNGKLANLEGNSKRIAEHLPGIVRNLRVCERPSS